MWKYWGDDSEHVLLLQRAWVQVPASTPGGSEPPVISAPTPLASAGTYNHMHTPHTQF